jgi:polyisoprenoid-binding protein YceI
MNKVFLSVIALVVFAVGSAFAPAGSVLMTRTGHISFYSSAKLENIEAHNYQVSSSLNTGTGDMAYSVLIKSFQFKKALMQEHFNENYMESDKYPKSTFKGKITDISKVNFDKDGTYNVKVQGDLMIHNVTKNVTADGTVTVKGGEITAKSKFPVRVKDYNITIPSVVSEKIAEVVDVTVDVTYKK